MHANGHVAYLIAGTKVEFAIGEAVTRENKTAMEVANNIFGDLMRNSGWQ
jgi:hypothetical protein